MQRQSLSFAFLNPVHLFSFPQSSLYSVFSLNFTLCNGLLTSGIPALLEVKCLTKFKCNINRHFLRSWIPSIFCPFLNPPDIQAFLSLSLSVTQCLLVAFSPRWLRNNFLKKRQNKDLTNIKQSLVNNNFPNKLVDHQIKLYIYSIHKNNRKQ